MVEEQVNAYSFLGFSLYSRKRKPDICEVEGLIEYCDRSTHDHKERQAQYYEISKFLAENNLDISEKYKTRLERLLKPWTGKEEAKEVSNYKIHEALKTEKANEMMLKLVNAGILNEEWKPLCSRTEAAQLAEMLSEEKRLNIPHKWVVFGELWDIKPTTLRQYKNEAQEQKKITNFIDKVRKVLA